MFGLAVGLAAAGHGQIGVYGMPEFTRVSNSTPDAGAFSLLGPNGTSRIFSGVGVGLYDEFLHGARLDGGVDLRGTIQKGSNAHLNEFLIGARVVFKPEGSNFRPYAEVLGGVGGTRAATNPVTTSKGTYGGFVGLDYRVSKHVDLRLLEVGYSSLTTISTSSVTAAGTQPGASQLLHFGAGIVLRFPQPVVP